MPNEAPPTRDLRMERDELQFRLTGAVLGLSSRRWNNIHPFNVREVRIVDNTRLEVEGEEIQTQRGKTREVAYPINGDEVRFHYNCPSLGAINVHDQVVYIGRTPERQSRRGLRHVTIHHPNLRDLQFANMQPQFIRLHDRNLLWSVFNPQYFPLGKALVQVFEGSVLARALSPNLYVYSSMGLRYPLLGYKTRSIGHFTAPDRLLVYTNFQPVLEQLQEVNTNNAVTVEVRDR